MSWANFQPTSQPTYLQETLKVINGMIISKKTAQWAAKFIEGSKRIEFADWCYLGNCLDWPRIAFFEWPGIDQPKAFYKCEFNLAFNYVINYYAWEAAAQGITFPEFAAIVATVTHFIDWAAKDYPSFEVRKSQVCGSKPLRRQYFYGLEFNPMTWTRMPTPKGKEVKITVYVDADHAHDLVTRPSVTGILLFINNTPVKWYSKRQNTVESSTCGAGLIALRIATDIIIEFRYKLRMMGIPMSGPSVVLCDC